LLGVVMLPFSSALAWWLFFTFLCLGITEHWVFRTQLVRTLDTVDGMVMGGVVGSDVERFDTGQASTPAGHDYDGEELSTGLDDDIPHAARSQPNPLPAPPPTQHEPANTKNPTTAAALAATLGGFGLGVYLRTWPDFFLPFAIWAAVGIMAFPAETELLIAAPVLCAAYGYWRASRMGEQRETAAIPATASAGPALATRLGTLDAAFAQGLLTDTEYRAKRQALLAGAERFTVVKSAPPSRLTAQG
jgi:hypothetical protein